MIHLSERARRGWVEAVGVPGIIGAIMLVVLLVERFFETAA